MISKERKSQIARENGTKSKEAKTTGWPNWDGFVLRNTTAAKSTYTLMRQGKPVGTGSRTLSADGKTITVQGTAAAPDGKKTTTKNVFERQ